MTAKTFVPAHAAACGEIAELAQYNIDKVNEVQGDILALCDKPRSFDEVLKALFDRYGLTMNFEQYALVGSTVRSYLTWLKEAGRLRAKFVDNRLLFQA